MHPLKGILPPGDFFYMCNLLNKHSLLLLQHSRVFLDFMSEPIQEKKKKQPHIQSSVRSKPSFDVRIQSPVTRPLRLPRGRTAAGQLSAGVSDQECKRRLGLDSRPKHVQ